ncbi:unnamed protein product, partial [Choristocarpus tenellus]
MRAQLTLCSAHISPVPDGAFHLRGAGGRHLQVYGFIQFQLTLGSITLHVHAVILPSLGVNPSTISQNTAETFATNMTVASVSTEFAIPVHLRHQSYLPPGTETVVSLCSQALPGSAKDAVVDPIVKTSIYFINQEQHHSPWKDIIVSRSLTVWEEDGSCLVEIANPSNHGVKISPQFFGHISPVDQIHTLSEAQTSTIAATPNTPEELKQAPDEFKEVFGKKALVDTVLSDKEQELFDLVAKYRPLFSLTSKELGFCNNT